MLISERWFAGPYGSLGGGSIELTVGMTMCYCSDKTYSSSSSDQTSVSLHMLDD